MRLLRALCALAAVVAAAPAAAAPTAGELRATCERALADGYTGEDAAMCDWYVAPCGVCGKEGPPDPEWCVPDGVVAAEVASQVVAELKGGDDTRAAPEVVKEILRRRFPCGAEE